MCQTIEGVVAANIALNLGKKYKVKLPLAEQVSFVLRGKKKAEKAINDYLKVISKF